MPRTLVAPPLRCVVLKVRAEQHVLLSAAMLGGGYLLAYGLGPALFAGLPGGLLGFGGALIGFVGAQATEAYLRRSRERAGIREVKALEVVPWGVVTDYEVDRQPIPWARIGGVRCVRRVVRDRRRRDEDLVLYEMTFGTAAGDLHGYAEEQDALTLLPDVHLDYSRAASRRVALALEGDACLEEPLAEGAFGELRRSAQALLDGPLKPLLTIPAGDYRSVGQRAASPELVDWLGRCLTEESSPDRGPIAALLAAELTVTRLQRPLLDLVLSPHPLLCAVARGAARRLGAHPLQTGAFDEISPFLPDEELSEIEAWSKTPAPGGEPRAEPASVG